MLALAREERSAGDNAVLTVQDPGVGIAEKDLPHIFEWFYRGTDSTGEIDDTGLGLAGARQFVEQHGGTITVESQVGGGIPSPSTYRSICQPIACHRSVSPRLNSARSARCDQPASIGTTHLYFPFEAVETVAYDAVTVTCTKDDCGALFSTKPAFLDEESENRY
jgi:Histidine kinase-, DNA gyrase B-, and HSP90-like ATPase